MSEITNPEELDFLKSQWDKQSMPLVKANKADVLVTDPLELSELREDASAKENWLEDPMMSSRAILDGAFWGWSDEVGASIAAAVYQTFLKPEESDVQIPQEILSRFGVQPEDQTSSSYFDVRREMMSELEKEKQEWAVDNTGLNLGLNLLGGVATGGFAYNLVKSGLKTAGTLSTKVPGIQQGTRAVQQARLQGSLAKANQNPASVTALESSIARDVSGKNLKSFGSSPLQATLAEVPTLAATGALAAAGFANQDDDLGSAVLTGAGLSVALGAPMTGIINYVANGTTTNRIAQQLGKGRDFVPIGMAALKGSANKAEKALEYGYNKIVRHAFGADSLLAQQQKRFTNLADQELAQTERTIENSVKTANRALAATKKSQQTILNEAKEQVKSQSGLNASEKKIALEEAVDTIKFNAVADADAATNAAAAALRIQAHKNAIPQGTPQEKIDYVFKMPNMHQRQKEINELWSEYGFQMLKNKKFRINPEEIGVKVRTAVGSEKEFLSTLSGNKPVNAANVINEYLASYVTKGNWIEGATLNNLRTTVAEMANKLGTEGADAANRIVLKELVKVLDDAVFPQLSKSNQAAFKAQKLNWGQNITVRDAVVNATRKNGMFTPEEYLGAVKSNNRRAAQEGKGFLQPEANKIITQTANSESAIKKLAAEQVKKQARTGAREASKDAVATQKRIDGLKAQAKSKVLNAEAKADALKSLEVENIRLANLKATKESYSKIEAKTDASPFFKLFSTALLGLGNPLQGLAVGTALGTQNVQRLLAGQQQWQTALNKSLQSADQPVAKLVQTLGRTAQSMPSGKDDLDSSALNTLNNASLKKQLQAYDKIEKSGQLETLKVRNPRVYRTLEQANATR
mgnify:FL=1